jgi:hypothetical protein
VSVPDFGLWPLVRIPVLFCALSATETAWAGPEDDPWTVLFSSAEIGSSMFSGGGFKRSLTGPLAAGGFVLLGTAGAGSLRDREVGHHAPVQIDYMSTQGSLLIGHQWKLERGVWALMVGGEADLRQPVVNGTLLEREDPLLGLRVQAEFWLHPTENTVATGTLIAGTSRPHLWARATWGYRVWQSIHVGPEAALSLEPNFAEGRLGVHLTGLRIRSYHLRLSGGILFQNSGEPAAYGTLGTYFHL